MKYLTICIFALMLTTTARAESEFVTFPMEEFSGETTVLRAKLTKPEGDGPFPAVVLLHGCNGTDFASDWAETYFESLGYVSLRIDSFRPRGFSNVCGGRNWTNASPSIRALDAHAGKDFLAGLPYVDGDRIGVIGWSHGGMTVLNAVSNKALNQPDRADPFKAAIAFYPRCTFRLHRLDAPLLVMIGSADDWTPVAYCEAMTLEGETAHDYELVIYPGATHAFDITEPWFYFGHYMEPDPEATEDAYRRLEEFLERHLEAP